MTMHTMQRLKVALKSHLSIFSLSYVLIQVSIHIYSPYYHPVKYLLYFPP